MSNSTVFGPGSTITSGWLNDVNAVVYGGTAGGVTSFNGRYGVVSLTNSDVVSALTYIPVAAANPIFTGSISASGTATPFLLNSSAGSVGQVLTSAGPGATPTWTTVSGVGGSGTVTTVSVVSANGFAGTVANPTTTPAITLTTSITGLLKGNGTAISAAVAGTDFVAPSGALGTPSSGNLVNCTFPTLNQNTTGTAAGLSATLGADKGGTGVANNAASTITISGSFASTFSVSGAYTYTFPPSSASLGYLNVPQNSQSTAYTCVLSDSGKHILHPSADTAARVFTIPANSSVAYPIGTAITFVNQDSAGTVTISITTDTMRLAGAGTTGSRTLAANGVATALKITSTEWIISGTGLT